MAAIVPLTALGDDALLARLGSKGRIRARIAFPSRAFARHGTTVDTGLLVVDRTEPDGPPPPLTGGEDLAACAALAAAVTGRAGVKPRARLEVAASAFLTSRNRSLALPSGRLGFLTGAAPVAYQCRPWAGVGDGARIVDGDVVQQPPSGFRPGGRLLGRAALGHRGAQQKREYEEETKRRRHGGILFVRLALTSSMHAQVARGSRGPGASTDTRQSGAQSHAQVEDVCGQSLQPPCP